MRTRFVRTASDLLDHDPRTALVLADISAAAFAPAAQRHPDRVLNLGIREQLMIGVAGGLALTGLRPIVHSYATFAVDRTYEQLKLDLDHQDAGAVVATIGASYDAASEGRTHQSPGDVALLDTLTGWTVHVPGHPDEVEQLLRAAAGRDDRTYLRLGGQHNDLAHPDASGLQVIHRGGSTAPVVVAVGPMLHRCCPRSPGWTSPWRTRTRRDRSTLPACGHWLATPAQVLRALEVVLAAVCGLAPAFHHHRSPTDLVPAGGDGCRPIRGVTFTPIHSALVLASGIHF